jgi:hypothetical protein
MHIKNKYIFIIIALCCGICILCNIGSAQEQQREKREDKAPYENLYEYAKAKGSQNAMARFISNRSVIAPNIRALVRYSTDIIIGRPMESKTNASDKGDEIHKYIKLFVQKVYKGNINKRSNITVKTMGGSWMYDDGTTVSWQPIDAFQIINNNSYVLFINKENDNNYLPSLGIQSIFKIETETNTITPIDMNKRDPVVRKYLNMATEEFIKEITSTVNEEVRNVAD